MPPTDAAYRSLIEERGWRSGTALENRVAFRLSRLTWTTDEVLQQHRVGKYRIDFAWPKLKLALEVDGWHHRRPETAAKDAERDAYLRAEGWITFRVDDLTDVHTQVSRVCLLAWLLWEHVVGPRRTMAQRKGA